jgi:carboxylate-amine ligase
VYESHPTSGIPYTVYNWAEFNELYEKLIDTESIETKKDIWWDIRPSPLYGTLELRICDGPATKMELESVVAFIHMMAYWFRDNKHHFYKHNKIIPEYWIMRENKWRAIRYGLDAQVISHETLKLKSLSENIQFWLERLEPYAVKLGYLNYVECLRNILKNGNSSSRQRQAMKQHNDIRKVIEWNVREFEEGAPIWN